MNNGMTFVTQRNFVAINIIAAQNQGHDMMLTSRGSMTINAKLIFHMYFSFLGCVGFPSLVVYIIPYFAPFVKTLF
jgi:hypothetical protein